MNVLADFWVALRKRLVPFLDITLWLLLGVALIPLAIINPAMLITLLQWTAFAVALAGVAVLLCRVMLPMIDLGDLYDTIRGPDATAAHAIVFAAVVGLLAVLFYGLVVWGKA